MEAKVVSSLMSRMGFRGGNTCGWYINSSRPIAIPAKETVVRVGTRKFLSLNEEKKDGLGHFRTFGMIFSDSDSTSSFTLLQRPVEHGTGERRVVIWQIIGLIKKALEYRGIEGVRKGRYLHFCTYCSINWVMLTN